ncbi:MAG: 50S ribosomal protein L6 [Phycisphaerales bacterium]|jgi:large subunit ribosomal protein L6|nr:50S ribosomal protein L6 [Phycisphaerales bacterium]
MSRIGKKPIEVPKGVKVDCKSNDRSIGVSGPKGSLTYTWHAVVDVDFDESSSVIRCALDEGRIGERTARAQWGTTRSRIQNMVTGVTQGYTKVLNIVGVGWNAKPMGKNIQLNVGYCHPVDIPAPEGVEFEVENGTRIKITGADKHAVGQFAANIRDQRRPEPYNGKGILYAGEIIIRKQGKVFGA